MTRAKLLALLTNAVAASTNQTWPEDRHIFKTIRNALNDTIPKGTVIAVLTDDQATALYEAAQYRLEFAGEGDHSHVKGPHAAMLRRACAALGN